MGENRNLLFEAGKEFEGYRLLGLRSLERMTAEQMFRAEGSQGNTLTIFSGWSKSPKPPQLKDGCQYRFPKDAPRHTVEPWPLDIPIPFDRPREGALSA
jgi:hypothetical protein